MKQKATRPKQEAIRPMIDYTKQVLKHFRNPHNMGRMKDADAIGKVGNPICGDVMWLYIRVKEDKAGKRRIKDISFETFGCVAAIATSSMITDLARGKTLEEAMQITREDVASSLGSLPPIKIHCSVLAADALQEAIYDYYVKHKLPIPKQLEEGHKRVQRHKEEIAERYKDWLKLEEEMHEK